MNTQTEEAAISGLRKVAYVSLVWCVALLVVSPAALGVRLFPVPIGTLLSIPFLCVGVIIPSAALYLGWGYFGVVTAYACIAKHRKVFRRAFYVLAASLAMNIAGSYGLYGFAKGWHDGISLYRKNTTKPMERSRGLATVRACARPAPSIRLAHLER